MSSVVFQAGMGQGLARLRHRPSSCSAHGGATKRIRAKATLGDFAGAEFLGPMWLIPVGSLGGANWDRPDLDTCIGASPRR